MTSPVTASAIFNRSPLHSSDPGRMNIAPSRCAWRYSSSSRPYASTSSVRTTTSLPSSSMAMAALSACALPPRSGPPRRSRTTVPAGKVRKRLRSGSAGGLGDEMWRSLTMTTEEHSSSPSSRTASMLPGTPFTAMRRDATTSMPPGCLRAQLRGPSRSRMALPPCRTTSSATMAAADPSPLTTTALIGPPGWPRPFRLWRCLP